MARPTQLVEHARTLGRLCAMTLVLALIATPGGTGVVSARSMAAPASSQGYSPAASVLPSGTCPIVAGAITCDLWAMTGTVSLSGGATAPIWGYSVASTGPASLPGPTLVLTQGMPVVINLHNVNLPSATSLTISEQPISPDTTGVTAGNSKSYTIGASTLKPGTFLYEAGLTPDGPRQVAMGLVGALIVRPSSASGTAYGTATSAFDDEAALVLSEIDPDFNAAPLTFDTSNYNPRYWLINGRSFPDTDTPLPMVTTSPGHRLLLRYINAGLKHHSMSLLGLHQTIIAVDGDPYQNAISLVAQTIPTGETLDTIVTITTSVPAGTKYALYDAAIHMDNAGALAPAPSTANPAYTPLLFGGMLTFITVAGASTSNGGPLATNVAITPNPSNGLQPATLSASIQAVTGTVSAAEYFTDSLGPSGSGVAMSGSFGIPATSATATIPTSVLAALSSGNHSFFVHGQDSTGTWGPIASVVLNLDKTGPAVSNIGLSPSVTNGSSDLLLQATASDVATGNQPVIAAEYFIDPSGSPSGGSGTPLSLPFTATVVSLNATVVSPTLAALSEGLHQVAIRAEDALGNWGPFGTIPLTIDKTGPTASNPATAPNPTNGTIGIQTGSLTGYFHIISATISDPVSNGVNSHIAAAEYFIDTVTANGTGSILIANDGAFNQPAEMVYQALPLYAIYALPQGAHTIYIHGQDAAGNWGPLVTTTLYIDKTGPNTTLTSLAPNPTHGSATVNLTASATDPINVGTPATAPASNIVAAEYFVGPDLGGGTGKAMTGAFGTPIVTNLHATIPVNGSLAYNSYLVSVRARDAASNWGPAATRVLDVLPADGIFADGFETGNLSRWNGGVTGAARLSVTNGASMGNPNSVFGMQALVSAGIGGYVTDVTPAGLAPAVRSYHARFYFNPNGTATGFAGHDIFDAFNGALPVFRVQYRFNAGQAQVRVLVTLNAGTGVTNWYNISVNTPTAVEVSWQSAANATFSLYTNGTLRQALSGLNTSANVIQSVRLGAQGALGGVLGIEYFDSFVSTRTTLIGQ